MSPTPLASAASSCPRPCLLPILLVLGLPCRQEPRPAQARDPLRRPPRRQPWPPRAPPVAAPCLLSPDPIRMGRGRSDPCPSGLLCHPASPEACSRRRVHVPCELPASSEATSALTMPSLKFQKRSECEDSFDYVGLSS